MPYEAGGGECLEAPCHPDWRAMPALSPILVQGTASLFASLIILLIIKAVNVL
jgi:hypothetical protein